MKLEYYTLAQAARALGSHEDEIEHLLETGKLKGYLYTFRKYFVVIEVTDHGMIGRGIGSYTGLIYPHPSYLESLLKEKKVVIKSRVLLLNLPSAISNWTEEHNFKSQPAFNELNLIDWNPWRYTQAMDRKGLIGIPKPIESTHVMRVLGETLNKFVKEPAGEPFPVDKYPEYSYSYSPNGDFKKEDIRIRHQDLFPLKEKSKPQIQKELNRQRHNAWHDLLAKVISDNIDIKPREIIQLLKSDLDNFPRKLDTDEIITQIDKDFIHWVRPDGLPQKFKRTGLPPLVSRLKKELIQ